MSAPRIRGDYEQLTQIAQAFGAQAAQLETTRQRLRREHHALQAGDWLGEGAYRFYAEMETAVLPALQRLAEALHQAQRVTMQMIAVVKQAEADAAACF